MEYKYNFTFIIPHKNLPELLKRCVLSIPRRDDVQIIIVDDNSDPDVVDFNNFPFSDEPNINIIFDKTGKRQGHARNVALEHAEGKWIMFADSDDFFFYSINKALDDCLNSDADIIYYKSTNLDSDTYKADSSRSGVTNTSIERYLRGEKYGEDFMRFRHPAPWGKFIRSSSIKENNITFPEIIKAEDVLFSAKCGLFAKKIEVNNVAIYCLTSREGNTTSVFSPQALKAVATTETDLLKLLKENNKEQSPVYTIWEMDIFSSLLQIKELDSVLYETTFNYIEKQGFSREYIKNKERFILNGNLKARFVASLPSWIRKLINR